MLGWELTLLIVAFAAAVFAAGGMAVASAGVAPIVFVIALALFVHSLTARRIKS
ncbi:DUF1328 domain-containing protein [Leisingera daeponensis]|uniref:DUF1328 domain-containing protein n=1 Tax=Leisingera daeponensis TaxID=405746 RepID=UPI001C983AA8|nr:DUF1328 domain-containing protein [Leisingera daeponensis]MBY6058044.1 DUF1328 domain-containing protein [Leisingera daeponensis]